MRTIARILAPVLLALAALNAAAGSSEAHDEAPAVTSCQTVHKGDRYITVVRWTAGPTTRYRDLTVAAAPFPGDRQVTRARTGWRRLPVVTGCKVLASGVVTVRTARARLAYTVTHVEEAPAVEAAPVIEARPAAVGRWLTPVTLYAPTLAADWQVDAVVAAWNTALPADRRITVTATPCGTDLTCIPIRTAPMADLYSPVDGLAWWVPVDGVMQACSIDLAIEVPTADRGGVLAHELGHCLGLPHWDNPASIMDTNGHPATPQPIDLAWVTDTYGATA